MGPLIFPDPPLSGDSVVLRPWAPGDLATVEEASRDPYIPSITSVPVAYSDDAGRAWLERQRQRVERGEGWPFAIADQVTEEALGFLGLWLQGMHRRAHVGYWVLERSRGRGLATAALRLVSGWALGELGLARVESWIEPWNVASQRAAERAGFVREGLLRSYAEYRRGRLDLLMYSVLPGDRPQ